MYKHHRELSQSITSHGTQEEEDRMMMNQSFSYEYDDDHDLTTSQEMIQELNKAINNGMDVVLKLPTYQKLQHYVVYTISVARGGINWTLQRRYKEFLGLHKRLNKKYKRVELPQLPRRKFTFGSANQGDEFLKQRRQELEEYIQKLVKIADPEIDVDVDEFLQFSKNFVLSIGPALCKIERIRPSLYKLIERLEQPHTNEMPQQFSNRGSIDSDDTTAGDQESGSKSSAGEEAESYYYKDILEDAFKQLRSVTLDLQSRLENLVAQYESYEIVRGDLESQIVFAENERGRIRDIVERERQEKEQECQVKLESVRNRRIAFGHLQSQVEQLQSQLKFAKKLKTHYYQNFKRTNETVHHSRKHRDEFIASHCNYSELGLQQAETDNSGDSECQSTSDLEAAAAISSLSEDSLPSLKSRGIGYAGELEDLVHLYKRATRYVDSIEKVTISEKNGSSSEDKANLKELNEEPFLIFKNSCTDYNASVCSLLRQGCEDFSYVSAIQEDD